MTEKKQEWTSVKNETTVSFGTTMPMRTYVKFDDTVNTDFGGCRWQYIQHLMNMEELHLTNMDIVEDIKTTIVDTIKEQLPKEEEWKGLGK